MSEPTYWLDLFTGTTWQEFLTSGATVSGFRKNRWSTVQKIKEGDILLCYMTGISRWIGALEVIGKPFQDHEPIWQSDTFPSRLPVKILIALIPETAVPITVMRDELSIFQNLKSPFAWTGSLRGSPVQWRNSDGLAIMNALQKTRQNPVLREVDKQKLSRTPRTLQARMGPVIIPDTEDIVHDTDENPPKQESLGSVHIEFIEPTLHTEVQWSLLKLGNDMGLDVWVARNDKNRMYNASLLSAFPRSKRDLPSQFDEATNKTIELIDVLWYKGNAIVAAFEIECTTSIYSGLLRMSDLISMQPNINIPLYIVAPDERRNKVFDEINRPTFSKLSPPMKEMCRFISISVLKKEIARIGDIAKHLRPEFLEDISESEELQDI